MKQRRFILDHIIYDKGKFSFYVKCTGYDNDDNSWIKENNFDTKDIINEYKKLKNLNNLSYKEFIKLSRITFTQI